MFAYARGLKSGHWFNQVNRSKPPVVKLTLDKYPHDAQMKICSIIWLQLWHMN